MCFGLGFMQYLKALVLSNKWFVSVTIPNIRESAFILVPCIFPCGCKQNLSTSEVGYVYEIRNFIFVIKKLKNMSDIKRNKSTAWQRKTHYVKNTARACHRTVESCQRTGSDMLVDRNIEARRTTATATMCMVKVVLAAPPALFGLW